MNHQVLVRIDPDLVPIVAPGVLTFEGVRLAERDPALDQALKQAEAQVRAAPPDEVAAVRAMYWRVGLDPTKRRPSSEALLRRVRRGDPLPRINALVDVSNWCSLELQLPYGLYDLAAIEGDVELRLGRPGEEYPGIRKDVVHVAGRVTLADRQGPFGNPTSDSARTMVTAKTSRALIVVFAPREVGVARVNHALDLTASRVLKYAGGQETGRAVV